MQPRTNLCLPLYTANDEEVTVGTALKHPELTYQAIHAVPSSFSGCELETKLQFGHCDLCSRPMKV